MGPLEVVLISGAFTLTGSLLAWFLSRRDKREDRYHNDRAPEAPSVQDIWVRQDRVERVLRSAVVLLGEVAEQWNDEHPPVLSKRHVAVIAEAGYLPPEWEPLTDDR